MQRCDGRRVRTRRTICACLALAAVTAAALVAVTVGAGAATPTKGSTTAAVVVSTADSDLGTVLVAEHTVYTLKANGTSCTAKCLKTRPPVLLPTGQAAATAGSGVDATKLGTASAGHGRRQVTYAGKRLYRFAKDRAPGDVNGDGKDKWGKWSAVTVASAADPATTAPTTTADTVAPDTSPPATAVPQTAPPETSPPATEPTTPKPDPKPPGGGGVGF
jgi:predicted lipoprotein with Yx(FWY)xxD motif